MQSFDEQRFKQQVDKALARLKTVLDNTRTPQYPADVQHRYDDKYGLAEFLTNTTIAAQINCLELLGANESTLQKLKKWSLDKSVTLRLKSEEKCTFDREETRKVESSTEYVRETKIPLLGTQTHTKTKKTITKITEYFWKFTVEYELFAFQGTNVEDKVVFQKRKGQCEIITTEKSTPRSQTRIVDSMDINLTWLFQNVNEKMQSTFLIDRSKKTCHTPRRNEDVEGAMDECKRFYEWTNRVSQYFTRDLFTAQSNHGLNLASLTAESTFIPVVPLFEEKKKLLAIDAPMSTDPNKVKAPVMRMDDVNQFLAEQKRSVSEKFDELAKEFPDNDKVITIAEANLVVTLLHLKSLLQHYHDGVNYIERLLWKQLVSAIGKEVTAVDFNNYMKFHNRKLFKKEYQNVPFSIAIRRPDHDPEGVLSIESQPADGSIAEPIFTSVRCIQPGAPMSFAINSATRVQLGGEVYLHSFLMHQFAHGDSGQSLNLVARARQFSGYILVVGKLISATEFEPKHAVIVQNKDELIIPLLLEQIPSAKEFRDAIESLSPEMQRFCKSFRAMQLESSLVGLCVIQIKPQLEKLLNIPEDSLTKEIELTQNLLELFIKYQLPSDLMTFDGDEKWTREEKLETVKEFVKVLFDMIKEAKDKELAEREQEAKYKHPVTRKDIQLYDEDDDMIVEGSYEIHPASDYRSRSIFSRAKQALSNITRGGSGRRRHRMMEDMSYGGAPMAELYMEERSHSRPMKEKKAMDFDGEVMKATSEVAAVSPAASVDNNNVQKTVDAATSKAVKPLDEEEEVEVFDVTKVPTELDKKFAELDEDGSVRPTIINFGETWTKKSQKALLAAPTSESLSADQQKDEKNRAFDLIDALSRSGDLSIDCASLHVVIAATHCFEKTLMDTLVKDNVNPIEKVERTALIIGSTIHSKSPIELIKPDQREHIALYSPKLLTQ